MDPLPLGARRALRLYREADNKRMRKQMEADARYAARKLLASGYIKSDAAKALRLYAGIDDGKWRTYSEVGKLMKITKEWVRKLLLPAKISMAVDLGNRVPWKPLPADIEHRPRL